MAGNKENVVIVAGDCSLTILPAFGGKVASLRAGSHELIHAPLHPYPERNDDLPFNAAGFDEGDAGGWDECLPSVAACTVQTAEGAAAIPDHGDLWRLTWQVIEETPDSATMRARCFSLPLELTRTILIAETAQGWRLHLLYSLANVGESPLPWSWAAHPLFRCQPGDSIVLPEEIQAVQVEGSRGNRLGRHGDTIAWPIAGLADGTNYDLRQAGAADAGTGDKLFAGPMREGWCVLNRPSIGLRITIRFDISLTPYLGLWLCYGGWPEGDGPKQVCIAPEPTTAPVDSLAEEGAWSRRLEPGETATWPMEIEIEKVGLERIKLEMTDEPEPSTA